MTRTEVPRDVQNAKSPETKQVQEILVSALEHMQVQKWDRVRCPQTLIWNVIYKFLNVCPFDYTAVAGSGKVGPVNQVNHTSWVAVVTPTDRTKSVRNRCVIELFVALFVLSLCPFDMFC